MQWRGVPAGACSASGKWRTMAEHRQYAATQLATQRWLMQPKGKHVTMFRSLKRHLKRSHAEGRGASTSAWSPSCLSVWTCACSAWHSLGLVLVRRRRRRCSGFAASPPPSSIATQPWLATLLPLDAKW